MSSYANAAAVAAIRIAHPTRKVTRPAAQAVWLVSGDSASVSLQQEQAAAAAGRAHVDLWIAIAAMAIGFAVGYASWLPPSRGRSNRSLSSE